LGVRKEVKIPVLSDKTQSRIPVLNDKNSGFKSQVTLANSPIIPPARFRSHNVKALKKHPVNR
jgi:hypothetical protein